MSKTLCKGIRKDGSPCQGNALDQYDGLCIAHGPPAEQAFQWRSEGGKNSATAARLDKRIPERFKHLRDVLETGLKQVLDGTLSPARYNASCRGVKMILDLYRQSDQEMDLIRAEEIQAAAAAYLGLHANLDVLEAAGEMSDRQDQFRAQALVDQGFAEFKEQLNRDDPPEIFLNDKGRDRFGYQDLDILQQYLNEIEDELTEPDDRQSGPPDLPEIIDLLEEFQESVEETLSDLARDDVAPFDPLTGQAITQLPAGVQTRSRLDRITHEEVKPQEFLEEQLDKIKQLMRHAEELARDEDDKQEPEEAATYGPEPELAPTYEQEPEEAATYGPELVEAETYGQELELAPTYGQEPEEAATSGQRPEEAETCRQEPEEAQQGSKKLQYIKETLKASGVPIESVPANFRWQ